MNVKTRVLLGLLATLAAACAESEGPVGLNELSGDGVDEAGEPSAWAEVYNATDADVSLAGWQIEAGTSSWTLESVDVPANGFVMLWFDGDGEQGPEHALFTIEGPQTLVVSDAGGEVVQTIAFPAITEGQSYGRLPDGAANWQVLDSPSPGALNDP